MKTRTRGQWAVVTAACLSFLLMVATMASVRPVAAAEESWSTYSMTYRGTAAGRGGLVGASGGLVAFSGGPGAVVGRLDAAPSGSAEASSIEPGTMARLVGGQVNDGAGDEVVGEPLTARAEFPGDTTEDSATQAGPQQAGPMTITGGQAEAEVAGEVSRARASVASFRVAGDQAAAAAFTRAASAWRTTFIDGDGGLAAAQQPRTASSDAVVVEGAYGDGRAVADPAASSLTSTVEVGVQRVVVRGALVVEGIVGRATAAAQGTDRTATATLDVATVTVGGVPVALDETGLSVAENQVVTGADVTGANQQLQELLAAAGIQVRLLETVETTGGRTAQANSGGVAIEVVTPSTSGVPRNELALVLGRGEATLSAEPPLPPLDLGGPLTTSEPPPSSSSPAATDSTATSTPPATGSPVTVPTPAEPDEPAPPGPEVAEAPDEGAPDQPQVVAAGMVMSSRTAYAGFAAWMLFTSTLPLLGALLLGRRP